eukprot:3478545-Rhodomonas_salina.1
MKKRKGTCLKSGGAEDTSDPMAWRKLDNHNINDISDLELAEYLVGISARLLLNQDYWPDDNCRWLTECVHSYEVR